MSLRRRHRISLPHPAKVSPHAVRGGLKAGQRRIGMLLLLPAAIAFGLVILYPFLQALALSLFEYTARDAGAAVLSALAISPGSQRRRMCGRPSSPQRSMYSSRRLGTLILGLGWALILNQPFRGRGAAAFHVAAALGSAQHRERLHLGLDLQQPLWRAQRVLAASSASSTCRRHGSPPPTGAMIARDHHQDLAVDPALHGFLPRRTAEHGPRAGRRRPRRWRQ